ncbi:hypothetical protein [Actibacterium lipolyticum]|uniref:hypothetical protein n=1 Tax=Actibacterium lipolyticum TaxID=1524263 RepID=UPI001F1F12D1|nr:hypothetical protein [Actibacterium lipolyticum]
MSAIDWLSNSVTAPAAPAVVALPEADIANSAAPETITVRPLGAPSIDAVGLLPASTTGLPPNLWGSSPTAELARLISAEHVDTLPAIQKLLYTLLLAELDPPIDSDGKNQLLLARLDKLLELGALEQAQALLERAGPTDPELFRRWFDVSLLTGHEDRACAAMRASPGIAPTFPARIFCLARGGDWNAAALTLETGKALGYLSDQEDALLLLFLDPEMADSEKPFVPPSRPSPLVFRMLEAIGEPLPTTSLPLAFAQADLRSTTGWKAQIEAAERLARRGAISANRLLGVYTQRLPAASGGIWERVDAVQEFDVAMLSGDPGAIAKTLPKAWAAMESAELEAPFAELYGERLSRLPLPAETAEMVFHIGLLSDSYELIAAARDQASGTDALLQAVAKGQIEGISARGATASAVIEAFSNPALSAPMEDALAQQKLGEALLRAIRLITDGARGDVSDVTEGLALLRRVGLEDTARRAALELLILERRG